MERKAIQIGLFGFGCVGQGLWEVLQASPGLRANIRKIGVKNRYKERIVPAGLLCYHPDDILDDPEIEVVVELIDDAEAAFDIVCRALRQGKSVVTANKKMLADNFSFLRQLQLETGSALLYEAASCASIPVIRNLEEYYDNDLLESLEGIVNGSSNYVLSAMQRDGLGFESSLTQAQKLGFAESNPQLDISGQDAGNKLVLLLAHAFGLVVQPQAFPCWGITNIHPLALRYAGEQGYRIKLIASAKRTNQWLTAGVWPAFVSPHHELFRVEDEFNGLVTQSCFADRQFFMGKGAGAHPTASAVLSDLSALTYAYRYAYKKLEQGHGYSLLTDQLLDVFVCSSSEAVLQTSFFEQIFSRYTGPDGAYLTGRISWLALKRSNWLTQTAMSVIGLPKSQLNSLSHSHLAGGFSEIVEHIVNHHHMHEV